MNGSVRCDRWCGVVALYVAACTATESGTAEPDANALPRCGNGIVDPATHVGASVLPAETCDDGPKTGSPDSLCSVECHDGTIVSFDVRESFFAEEVVRTITSSFTYAPHFALASALEQGTGCTYLTTFSPDDHVYPPYQLRVTGGSPATGVASMVTWDPVREMPVCVEAPAPGESSARMYVTTSFPPEQHPAFEEVPYPFEGTKGGRLFTLPEGEVGDYELLLIDQESGEFASFAAGIWKQPEDMWLTTELGDVPRGNPVSVEWLRADQYVRERMPFWAVHHFNDPPWIVVHEVASDGVIETVLDGPAPANVVDSDPARFSYDGTVPNPGQELAVLLEDGRIEIWSVAGGALTTIPFGQVAEGSRAIAVVGVLNDPFRDLLVMEPDGSIVVLINNGLNRALRPQRFSLGRTCEVCTLAGKLAVYDREHVTLSITDAHDGSPF